MGQFPRVWSLCAAVVLLAMWASSSALAARAVNGMPQFLPENPRTIGLRKNISDFLTLDEISRQVRTSRVRAHEKARLAKLATERLRHQQWARMDAQRALMRDLKTRADDLRRQRRDMARTLARR